MLFKILISVFSFPGVVVHEFSHKFFCDWAGVRVSKVCYFRFGNPAGYVIHEEAQKFIQSFFITVGPFILGTLFSILFFVLQERNLRSPKGFVFLWLAVSIAANSFPSSGDAKALWQQTKRQIWRDPLALFGFPLALVIWVVSFFSFFYLNFVWAYLLFGLVNSHIKYNG